MERKHDNSHAKITGKISEIHHLHQLEHPEPRDIISPTQGTQSTLPRPYGFDVYPPLENTRATSFNFRPTRLNKY